VRIHGRALSADEIRTLYQRDQARYQGKVDLEVRPLFDYPAPPSRGTCVALGTRIELFTDDWLLADTRGVALRLHAPLGREIALRFDSAWDGPFSSVGTVVQEGARYRMWYRGQATLDAPPVTCYAQSDDGVTWRKPDLGLITYADAKRPKLAPSAHNNIVSSGVHSYNFTPFLDQNPACPPEERFKAVANVVPWMVGARWLSEAARRALPGDNATSLFASPDGIRWKMICAKAMRGFDSQTPAFWDTVHGTYRMYVSHGNLGTLSAKQFTRWSGLAQVVYDDTLPERRYYAFAAMPYPRASHLLIGLASRVGEGQPFLDRTSPFAAMGGKIATVGAHDAVLMTSRDGLHFHRWMEAFLRPGPDIHNWTGHSQFALAGVADTGPRLPDGTPTELSLYLVQHYSLPSAHVVRVACRTDGFTSVHAPYAGGEFVTRPFTFAGAELAINFSTSAAGSIRIELQDESREPLPGRTLADCPPIYGDEISRSVRWEKGADLSALAGRPVRLHVVMKDADLYSIRFR
jgi:hypothetical protein